MALPTPAEVDMAELIAPRVPSMEMSRLVSSGTEAAMSAIPTRARRHRTRCHSQVRGCYHGHADSLLVKAGSGGATFGLPGQPGRSRGLAALTVDRAVQRPSRGRARHVGARPGGRRIIVEPVAAHGRGAAGPGFLQGLRRCATSTGRC